jgi:hypothetical protein
MVNAMSVLRNLAILGRSRPSQDGDFVDLLGHMRLKWSGSILREANNWRDTRPTSSILEPMLIAFLINLVASLGSSVPTTYKTASSFPPPADKRGVTLIMRPYSIVAVCT